MIKTAFLTFALAAATVTSAGAAGVAYLARTGNGSVCSLAAPCGGMTPAIAAAGVGGEVICLDKGNYGGVIITNSVTISCGDAFWEAPQGFILINGPAGTEVAIEGLVLDSIAAAGGNAMNFAGQGTLHLRRVRVGNNPGASGHGLSFGPAGNGTLHVSESVFYNNGGSGIHIRPTGTSTANVHLRNVQFERNAHGVFIDASVSSGPINVGVTASMFSENAGNGIGAFSPSSSAAVVVSVKDSHITGNLTNGLGALAAAPSGNGSAVIAVGSSMITANVNGVAASGAGQIRTFGNNQVLFNVNNGAFTGSVALQ